MKFNRVTVAAAALAVVAAGIVPLVSASAVSSQAAAKYQVGMKMSMTQAVAGEDTVTLTGKVSPAAPGTKVKVQVLWEGLKTWKDAGSAKVKKDSTYKFSILPSSHLDRAYRVVKAGDKAAASGTSKERALQVLKWEWLSSLTPSAMKGVSIINEMPINGDIYKHTLYTTVDTPSGYVEYTLGHNAYKLEATFGLSDRTETGGQGMVTLRKDGVKAFSEIFDLGQSVLQKTNVTDAFRIRIDFSQVADTPVTEPSVGAARVLMD
jgi:hypothetical protein